MATKATLEQQKSSALALREWNRSHNNGHWTWGKPYSSIGTEFQAFVINELLPKVVRTSAIDKQLGNRFNWLYKEVEFIGELEEEYVFKDIRPFDLDLSKGAEILLRRNYPQIISRYYHLGSVRKNKMTLNNNSIRKKFINLGQASRYAIGALNSIFNGFNVAEEKEVKGMTVDYVNTVLLDRNKRLVTSMSDLVHQLYVGIQNLQNNSDQYNEALPATGGLLGSYTTQTDLKDMIIITTDEVKVAMLNTEIANTFNSKGLDVMDHIISFDTLGGVWKTTADVTVTQPMVNLFRAYGDYQSDVGDPIPSGAIFTFDISSVITQSEEIKPTGDEKMWAVLLDINSYNLKRSTQNMMKEPFKDGDNDEVTHHFHYHTSKAMSPFYSKLAFMTAK